MDTNSYRDEVAADLMARLEREAQQQDSITVGYLLGEAIACIAAMRDIINGHDGPSDKADGPTERLLATVDQVALLREQCEAGLQVEHDCPAMYALACIYAEFFGDEDSGKHDATKCSESNE